MSKVEVRPLPVVLVVLFGLGHVSALSCYECTSSEGNYCLDPINETLITSIDCTASLFTLVNPKNEEFICISTTEQNSSRIFRTRRCGLMSEASICDTSRERNSLYNLINCKTCDTDLCNSSAHLRNNLFLLVFVMVSITFVVNKT